MSITIHSSAIAPVVVRDLLPEGVAMIEPTIRSSLPILMRAKNFHAGAPALAVLGAIDVARREARAMSRRTGFMAALDSSSHGVEHLWRTGVRREPFDPFAIGLVRYAEVPRRDLTRDELAWATAECRWRSAHVVAARKGLVELRRAEHFLPSWYVKGGACAR